MPNGLACLRQSFFFISSKPTSTASTTRMQNDPPTSISQKQPELKVIEEVINRCLDHDITNPVEVLRIAQSKIVAGRALIEVKDPSSSDEGLTNFILVDRKAVFQSSILWKFFFMGKLQKIQVGPERSFSDFV